MKYKTKVIILVALSEYLGIMEKWAGKCNETSALHRVALRRVEQIKEAARWAEAQEVDDGQGTEYHQPVSGIP